MATEEVLPTFGSLLDEGMPVTIKTQWQQVFYRICIALYIINVLLFVITFPFGVVSWILIPKWRQFSNFLFMNLSVVGTITMTGYYLCTHYSLPLIVVVLVLLVPRTMLTHWVLVAILMHYLEVVKVYNVNIFCRKYLKTTIFTWIVPIVEILTVYAFEKYFKIRIVVNFHYGIIFLMFSVIIVVYFITMHSMIKIMFTLKKSIMQQMIITVALIVPSGISSLLPVLLLEVLHSNLVLYNIALIICLFNLTTGMTWFLSFKQHRVLWAEYRRKRSMIGNV